MERQSDPAAPRFARLDDLADFDVAPTDRDVRGWPVATADGRPLGTVRHLVVDVGAQRVRYLEIAIGGNDARRVFLPVTAARLDDAHRRLVLDDLGPEDLAALPPARDADLSRADELALRTAVTTRRAESAARTARNDDAPVRIPLSAEELDVQRRVHQVGAVDVERHVETRHVREAVPVGREDVTIERRAAAPDLSRDVRVEGDEIRIPIFEERLFVEKRLVAVEEIVIRKHVVQREQIVEADLRRERVEVRGPDGTVREG
jgi:uncharacterized protein (TIGR02271 family)